MTLYIQSSYSTQQSIRQLENWKNDIMTRLVIISMTYAVIINVSHSDYENCKNYEIYSPNVYHRVCMARFAYTVILL